jgi:hypothetical protein
MANNCLLFSTQLEELSQEELDWARKELEERRKKFEDNVDEEDVGFSFEVDDKEATVWLYDEEYGDPSKLAGFIQAFIKKFRPHMTFYFSWAETCSKPRLYEFGGGAIGVSADKIVWVDPAEEVQKKLEKE